MPEDEVRFTGEALMAMLMFSLSSSSLLLVNKLCIHYVPTPSLVSTAQFVFCAIFIMALKASGRQEVDGWEWAKVKPYLLYIGMFVATIYCNMKALQHSNVETLIVFRACSFCLRTRAPPFPKRAPSLHGRRSFCYASMHLYM